jgi:addiction module HigA family antidote
MRFLAKANKLLERAKRKRRRLRRRLRGLSLMRMKNPPHPGELVGDNLTELGYSVAEAAKAMGVSRQALSNVIAGRSAISADMAIRLEKAIGSTADTWLAMQAAYDLAQAFERAPEIARLAPKAA